MLFPALLSKESLPGYRQLLDLAGRIVSRCVNYLIVAVDDIQKAAAVDQKTSHSTPILLLIDLTESLDGFGILVHNGSAQNCAQMVRTAFECQLGLFYIWEKEETYEDRALAYQLAHIHRKLKWAERVQAESNTGKELRRQLKGDQHADIFDLKDRSIPGLDIDKQVEHWRNVLASPKWAASESEWQRTKKADRNDPSWYRLFDGPKNIRELAYRVGKASAYESLYRQWSEVSHGENAFHRVLASADGQSEIRPVRSPEGLESICRLGCNTAIETVRVAIQKLIPSEWQRYRKAYVDELQKLVMEDIKQLGAFDRLSKV
jgi:hypothetical protein